LTVRSETRPRSFIEQARRRQIIDGAIDVLARDGYGAASLAAIAEEIGVSKGVISYYFAGKDELLRAVVTDVLAEASGEMRPQVQAASGHADALDRYITSNLDFIGSRRHKILALTEIFNNMRPADGQRHPYAEGHRAAVAALAGLLAAGQKAGEFGQFPAGYAAVALRAAIDAVGDLLRDNPDMDVREYGAALAGLFGKAVKA
jgi:AcrR family transcriptional regulator